MKSLQEKGDEELEKIKNEYESILFKAIHQSKSSDSNARIQP